MVLKRFWVSLHAEHRMVCKKAHFCDGNFIVLLLTGPAHKHPLFVVWEWFGVRVALFACTVWECLVQMCLCVCVCADCRGVQYGMANTIPTKNVIENNQKHLNGLSLITRFHSNYRHVSYRVFFHQLMVSMANTQSMTCISAHTLYRRWMRWNVEPRPIRVTSTCNNRAKRKKEKKERKRETNKRERKAKMLFGQTKSALDQSSMQ